MTNFLSSPQRSWLERVARRGILFFAALLAVGSATAATVTVSTSQSSLTATNRSNGVDISWQVSTDGTNAYGWVKLTVVSNSGVFSGTDLVTCTVAPPGAGPNTGTGGYNLAPGTWILLTARNDSLTTNAMIEQSYQ